MYSPVCPCSNMALQSALPSLPGDSNTLAACTNTTYNPSHALFLTLFGYTIQIHLIFSHTKSCPAPLDNVSCTCLSLYSSIWVTRVASRRGIANPLHKYVTIFLLLFLMSPQTSLPYHCDISCGHLWSLTNMPKSDIHPTPSLADKLPDFSRNYKQSIKASPCISAISITVALEVPQLLPFDVLIFLFLDDGAQLCGTSHYD